MSANWNEAETRSSSSLSVLKLHEIGIVERSVETSHEPQKCCSHMHVFRQEKKKLQVSTGEVT
ncbi:hypothetical protein F2P79_006925 [Pimephales promelas]|nr:hypothetical protein F2P79_006925 [Pimephales promelas]